MAHCADAVSTASQSRHHRRQRKGGIGLGGGGRSSMDSEAGEGGRGGRGDDDDDDELPEPQLLLSYARLVAGGYRPPLPPHFPPPVCDLIQDCWAAEPHERPRMADVRERLRALPRERGVVQALDSYLAGLADLGLGGRPTAACCTIS